MRLGGAVFERYVDPDGWVAALKKLGYSAAYCPVDSEVSDEVVKAYADAAERAGIVIAETGAWSNPLDVDPEKRRAALDRNRRQLALADRLGARCCVNISGSRGAAWDGPHPDNLTGETFDRIVQTVRDIIDDVKPTRTFYTLETMPWMYPDSADSYLRLMRAIDRKRFAVHLDPANLIASPQLYFENGRLVRDFVAKLGPHIRSCHAKDVLLEGRMTVHLEEVRAGLGGMDYVTYLRELSKLDTDVPLMIEHLATAREYLQAADYIRRVAQDSDVRIV